MKPRICMDFIFNIDRLRMRETRNFTSWAELKAEGGWGAIKPIRREWTSYAWPGGYPLYHFTQDNGILCTKCANKNLKLTLGEDPQWKVVHSEINYEDRDLYCDNCYEQIESVYGEEAEDESGS